MQQYINVILHKTAKSVTYESKNIQWSKAS